MRTDVLIADTDAELCGSYKKVFSESGLLVETATDGLECWSKIQTRCPDALVVDVGLLWGGSDGVLACLRDVSHITRTPKIFITGDDSPEVLSTRAAVSVTRCFQKPLRIEMVLNSMSDAFAT